MYVRYHPVLHHLTGCETGEPALGAILAGDGVTFFEVPSLPGPLDMLSYNPTTKTVVWRETLPKECRPASYQTNDVDAVVPEIPNLPESAVVDPPPGTRLASGDTYVTVSARYYLDHRFIIKRWTAEDEKARLIGWAANRRWEREMAGAPYRGHRVATDDRSKILMMGSVMASQMTPGWSTKWQFLDGGSLLLTGTDVAEMSLMAQSYVNSLFDLFGTVKDKILAGEITTEAEIDAILVPESSTLDPG